MSGGTINFSFLVGDTVVHKLTEEQSKLSTDELLDNGLFAVGEVIEVTLGREGRVSYYVKWPKNMYNPHGYVRGYDADDLVSAK